MPAVDPNRGQPGSETTKADLGAGERWPSVRPWIVSTLKWHLLAFITLNAVLTAANMALGDGWWAFWPLLISAALLAVHYLLRKTFIVNAGWVDERVEELNIKSYDRAHIEELKMRLGPTVTARGGNADDPPQDHR
jgi:hypothetical protein